MVTLEVRSNGATPLATGSTQDRVRQLWEADAAVTATDVGRRLGIPRETAGYHLRKLRGKSPATSAPVTAVTPPVVRSPRPRAVPVKARRDIVKDVGVVVVAAVMLAVSYEHIVHLALLAGCGWWAWVMPLPLDGMAVVSIRHLRHERRYLIAWAGIVIGLGGSLVANVVAFDPTLADMRHVGWAFAALPPLAVAVCLHLFDRGNRNDR